MQQKWHSDALCTQFPPDMFYNMDVVEEAVQVCNMCPVKRECLQAARQEERNHKHRYGVRAGLTPEQRGRKKND